MVDYGVSGLPEALLPKRDGPFKMDELTLMALLECPLCFEQLDVSARVLPCQHTFCMSCLQRQEAAHSKLFCPDCRTPVPARTVDELPVNLLLVRLLEGLQDSPGPGRTRQTSRYKVPLARGSLRVKKGQKQQEEGQPRGKQGHSEPALRAPASNQQGDSSGESSLTLGGSVTPKHKVDENGHHGNTADSSGASVSGAAPQAVSQVPQGQPLQMSQPLALCRALYDFNPEEMNLEDCKCCLSFLKGDVLIVIRRVDEHWIEARLGEKVGVCPLQFTEPNAAAAKLLEGKNRRASDSAEFHHRTGSGGKDKATDVANRTSQYGVPQVPAKTPIIHALPVSNQQKQPAASSSVNFYQTVKGDAANIGTLHRQGLSHRLSVPTSARGPSHPSRVNSQRVRRHSNPSDKHLLQSERKKMTSEAPPTISVALVNPQMSSASADGKNSSTQQLAISVCAVLYSYKPRRPEELELRKGEMVGVYGKFTEGWLRGLSLRTGKVGILPSNYISPVLRTSARLLETKAANVPSQYGTVSGKKPTAAKNPAVVLALDRVSADGTIYSTGQVPSVPNGAQHAMSTTSAGKPSLYGGAQGWDTVRRIFNPHRGSNQLPRSSNGNIPSNSQHFAQVQVSGYSPALQRKKSSSILPISVRPAPSAAAVVKDRDFTISHEATFQHDKQPSSGPQSILVRPDSHKNNTDKPAKSVRFLADEDLDPPRPRTSSWSSGSQVHSNSHSGPPPLEVWAPSLTLGRDGPGIVLREGKVHILRKNLDPTNSDLSSNPQKLMPSQMSSSAMSAQFSPSRHRVTTTHLAQTESELSLLQGELVLVHRPRPDGRVLVTQESSGQTGLFHSNVLQALERLS